MSQLKSINEGFMWGQLPATVRQAQFGWSSQHSKKVKFVAESATSLPRMPCQAREVRDFHKWNRSLSRTVHIDRYQCYGRNRASGAGFAKSLKDHCTKSGHGSVDGLHSIENTDSCRRVFSIDEKNRKRRTGLFFDNFLSFSGWCGVRGSSAITFLIARLGKRVSKGL
jgi:hypothetical protein